MYKGVKAVANDITVRLTSLHERTDTEIAQGRRVRFEVEHDGASGQGAERAAWAAPGVTQVEDRITVVP